MKTYLIADTHFGHKNILEFEETREMFGSVEEMDQFIINNWNKTVNPEDTVYHLGDFGLNCKYDKFKKYLSQLNGKIILIQGNHDDSKTVKKLADEGLLTLHEVGIKLKLNKQVMWLSHYPMEIGERPNKFSIHGHIHSQQSTYINQINVGVDSTYMSHKDIGTPIDIEELLEDILEINKHLTSNYKR